MLVEFRFKNYKCFRDEQVFSLVASADKTAPENLAELPDQKLRLLKSAVVYGPNAAGKTSLLDALYFFTTFVRRSAQNEADAPIAVKPFLFDEQSKDEPSSFEAVFIHEGVRYQYGFTVNQERVLEEWLFSYPKGRPRRLFRRAWDGDEEQFEFSVHLKGEKTRLKSMTRPNALFLSVGAAFNHQQLTVIHRWLSRQIRGLQAPYAERHPAWLTIPPETRDKYTPAVQQLLQLADVGIVDFSFVELDMDELPSGKLVLVKRSASDSARNKLKLVSVDMFHRSGADKIPLTIREESRGTQQVFSLGFFLLPVLSEGKVAFVDELDASLHPLLVRKLVELFHHPATNPKNAQLIFNTHDTTLLSRSLFRRDQIWLVEKDEEGAAHLYSLLEYSPRRDEALEKGYLMGRYGAIPFLGEPAEGLVPHE